MLHRDPSSMTTACIVQRIARQALATFRGPCPGHGASFLDNHSKLRTLMSQLRAKDLSLVPRKGDGRPSGSALHPFHGAPPVTYMHICETEDFSMGVFLLTAGASIPLHDHPGMHGLLRVVYGTARITCFDRTDTTAASTAQPGAPAPSSSSTAPPPPAPLFQRGALRRSALRSAGEYTEDSPPCVLSPHANNLHRIDAVGGPTAFLDVLAPPYEPDDGRDCHYYKVLPPPPSSAQAQAGCGAAVQAGSEEGQEKREDKEVWLMEISQPSDFWCGSEQYPGPHVTL